jgi:hypothetical protein
MTPELPTQLLTTEDVAWVWQYDKRTIATWMGGRKKKPQITLVRNGREIRFTRQAVLEHILAHTVQAEQPWSNGGPQAKLAEEIIDRAWGKIERLIELSVKAQVMREMKCIMHKEAA